MDMVGAVFKALKILMPFFLEVLFGSGEEGKEVIKRNKMTVFLMGCMGVLFLFYYRNSYLFDTLVVANNALGMKEAVMESKLDTNVETIKSLQQEIDRLHGVVERERARTACPGALPPNKSG